MAGQDRVTYGQRLRDPTWLVPMAFGAAMVAFLFLQGFSIAWGFLALLLIEVLWTWTVAGVEGIVEGVERIRLWIHPLKRIPGGIIGLPLLLVGLVLGSTVPEAVGWIGDGMGVAIRAIADAAPYIIFFTLTPAIVNTIRSGGAGRFALHVNLTYLATTVAAGVYAILMVSLIFQVRLAGAAGEGVGDTVASIGQTTFLLMFSSAPFLAIWSAAGIALLVYGFRLRGVEAVANLVGGKFIELLGDLLKVLLPLILFALGIFIPTNVSRALDEAKSEGIISGGSGWIGGMSAEAAYGVSVGVLVVLLAIWVFTAAFAVMRYTHFPLRTFFKDYFSEVYPYAWATSSSSATIPINLERTGEALKVRSQVRDFIIPLGATVNLDGTMMGAMVTSVAAAQLVGYTPTIADLITILIPVTMVTVGVPGIPGGLAALAGPIIADILPLDPAVQPVFIAIFIGFNLGLSDQFRTGVNSVDNGILSRLFEYLYPRKYQRHVLVESATGTVTRG